MRSLRPATMWKTAFFILTAAWTLGSPPGAGAATVTRTVCASGCGYTTIQAAHDAATAGDTIEVVDAVHTEAGVVIDRSLTIQGFGATATIVQADVTPGTASDRLFAVLDDVSLTLRNLTLRHGNTSFGGAISTFGEDIELRIENAILTQNQAGSGGAINANSNGTVDITIVDSAIVGNTAETWSAVTTAGSGGSFTMIRSTVSGNTDTFGSPTDATLDLSTPFTIANSTISGNTSAGIASDVNGTIINTTVTANTAFGVVQRGGPLTVGNSIVWENGTDCGGTLTIPSGAPNLDGDGSCTGFTLQNADADLEPLQNNGGPTETHALGDNSDALEAGDNAICAAAPVDGADQRGVARPQGDDCDLGAYEKAEERVCTDIDDSDPAVDYRIGWHLRTSGSASNGSYHRRMGSNQGNSLFNASTPTARVTFDGDEVTYHYVKSDRGGTAKIYIDGVLIETLSYGPGQNGAENPTFGHSRTYSGLSDGQHELVIEHLTGAVYVDGFTFCGTGGPAGVAAARFGSQTQTTTTLGLLLFLNVPVSVGADDVHVSAVVEGSAVSSVKLKDPVSTVLTTALQLLSGNATVHGLDAPVSATGSHTVAVLPTLLGLLSPVEVSVAKTFRRP